MIRTLTLSVVALGLFSGVALADPMASRFGNTLVATNAQGDVTKLYYNEDGTFTTVTPAGEAKGTWEAKDGQICLTQVEPAAAEGQPNPLCSPLTEHAVGEKWEIGEGDAKLSLELVAGR